MKASRSNSRAVSARGRAVAGDGARGRVEVEAAHFDGGLRAEFGNAPAQDRPDPQDQLAGRERLGDVVVRAGFQAQDPVVFRSEGGEHDDRDTVCCTEPAADFHAVQARQHPVQQDEVRAAFGREAQGGEPVGGEDHLESRLDEVVADHPGDGRLVLDEEDAPVLRCVRGRLGLVHASSIGSRPGRGQGSGSPQDIRSRIRNIRAVMRL